MELRTHMAKLEKLLLPAIADREDEDPAVCQLLPQGIGNAGKGASGDDAVKRSVFRKPTRPVTDYHLHVVVPQLL